MFEWLRSDEFRSDVERVRKARSKEERDKLKKYLPAITVSGVFNKRETAGLREPTGLILIDIDGKDNPHHTDMEKLKQLVFELPFVAMVMLSCSGSGVLAVVELDDYRNQYQHSLALAEDFAAIGVKIDSSCKDLPRFRFASYDPNPLYRDSTEVYTRLCDPATLRASKTECSKSQSNTIVIHGRPSKKWVCNRPETMQEIMASMLKPMDKWPAVVNPNHSSQQQIIYVILAQIANTDFDVTELYSDWVRIAALLALHFGDDEGRELFHDVSRNHPSYIPNECDELYDNFIYTPNKNYSINQLQEMAKHYGF